MSEVLKSLSDCVSALKMQLLASLSIPLSDSLAFDGLDTAAIDGMASRGTRRSVGNSFECMDDQPGYLTGNGLGSLEIGAAHDD